MLRNIGKQSWESVDVSPEEEKEGFKPRMKDFKTVMEILTV